MAMSLLKRGVNSTSGDRRIILTAFDILRENGILSPSISADQFLGKNFIEHKIIILQKVGEYINNLKRKSNVASPLHSNSKSSSPRNSPDTPHHPYHLYSKSYLYSNDVNENNNITTDGDLDDEMWVHKYVNNLEDESTALVLNQLETSASNRHSINNDNDRSSVDTSLKNILDTNIDTSVTDSSIKYTLSESDLKKLIEMEVNKQINYYNEKQALIIEKLRRSFDAKISLLEQRLHNSEP